MYTPKFNYKFLLIVSICLLVFGIGFGFFGFPILLRKMIKGVSLFLYDHLLNLPPVGIYFIESAIKTIKAKP